MKVVKTSDVKIQESTSKIFTGGKVSRQDIFGENPSDFRVSIIHFSPGAVNVLHSHTFDQILYVTGGKGIVATEKEEITVSPGTFIFIPAGEKHWHGATKKTAFSHIAIMPPGETSF